MSYTYDAWGKALSATGSMTSTLGAINPFRYRHYIYDTETELYYLRSRYYNPKWGRFINADSSVEGIGDNKPSNAYWYCADNPFSLSNDNGNVPYYGLDISHYGLFHWIVQMAIKDLNKGVNIEYVTEDRKYKIDLVKDETWIYEVKPNNPWSIAAGLLQVENYAANTKFSLGNKGDLKLSVFDPVIIGGITIQLEVEARGPLILYKMSYKVNEPKKMPILDKSILELFLDATRSISTDNAVGGVATVMFVIAMGGVAGKLRFERIDFGSAW